VKPKDGAENKVANLFANKLGSMMADASKTKAAAPVVPS
jgi:hypothetical protein